MPKPPLIMPDPMNWKNWSNSLLMAALLAASPTLNANDSAKSDILPPELPFQVSDARRDFFALYCAIRHDHGYRLPDDRPCDKALWTFTDPPESPRIPPPLTDPATPLRVIIVPGLFGECVNDYVNAFSDALAHLRNHGYRTSVIEVSGRASSAANAEHIRQALLDYPDGERRIVIGYSKGLADSLEALVYPEARARIDAIVGIGGVVGGTPLADRVPNLLLKSLRWLTVPQCAPGDNGGVQSLRREVRQQWLADHPLPDSIRFFSLAAFADTNDISLLLRPSYQQLADFDSRNDSQVIFSDAVIPGSTLLGYARADHWAIALPFGRRYPLLGKTLLNHNGFPREVLLEAVVRFVESALSD